MSKPPKIEYHTFEYLRKTLIQVHNRNVRREFHEITTPDNTPRSALNQATLIRPDDPVGTIILRLELFNFALGHIDKLVTSVPPEIYDVRKEQKIPQLVMVWRQQKSVPTQYKVSIPHYDGVRHPKMPTSWHKGSHVGTIHLKDNSHIRLYAKNEHELDKMISHCALYVSPGYIHNIVKGQKKGKPIKEVTVYPLKATYYQHGINSPQATWVCYFDKHGVCH